MRDVFVQTKNVAAFMGAIEAVKAKRGPKMVFVKGDVGLGKTRTCAWHAAQNRTLYLEAQSGWNIGWLLDDLCFEIGIAPAHKLSNRSRQVKDHIGKERMEVIIDEADRLKHDRRVLETIQSIHDASNVPVILVGMGEIDAALKVYPQLSSRIYQRVEFQEIARAELPSIFNQLAEVEIPADAIDDEIARGLKTMRAIERFIPDIEKAVRAKGGPSRRADKEAVGSVMRRRRKGAA